MENHWLNLQLEDERYWRVKVSVNSIFKYSYRINRIRFGNDHKSFSLYLSADDWFYCGHPSADDFYSYFIDHYDVLKKRPLKGLKVETFYLIQYDPDGYFLLDEYVCPNTRISEFTELHNGDRVLSLLCDKIILKTT